MDCRKTVDKIKPSIALVLLVIDNKVCSKGSGFIYLKENLLVTCNHVIDLPNATVKLKFSDSEELIDAQVVIKDIEHDLALLKFDSPQRPPLKKSDSEIKEGMSVVFSGFPLDLINLTTHQGIISAILEDPTGMRTYMIDGTINSGNSGCPLLTTDGDVIGVVNAKRRENTDFLDKVEQMQKNMISIQNLDLADIFYSLIRNVQLGMGYAVPCSYIPSHQDPKLDLNKSVKIESNNIKASSDKAIK